MESGSIMSALLTKMLEHIDYYTEPNQRNGMTPFLLLDGHGSHFKEPFLDCINNNKHKWKVCIRVPYGTNLWQVGDSAQQNGSFKMALKKVKK